MATYQNKIHNSFNNLIEKREVDELDNEILIDILDRIIDLAVKEDRGENIDSNIKAQTNNLVDLFNKRLNDGNTNS